MNRTQFDTNLKLDKSKLILNVLIGTLLPVFLLTLVLSTIYLENLQKIHKQNLDELRENILLEKKIFLRDAIERTISEIEHIRAEVALENRDKHLSQKALDSISIRRSKDAIRALLLTKERYYIWVNQIIDYEGGENYAIRAVHPNLPHTEGMLLSTQMEDRDGNRPYKRELEGIKSSGELYHDYYFKKLDSGKIAHKLSFAKLYKPFDWVIATGIYLDDFDALIVNKTKDIEENYQYQRYLSIVISLIAILSLTVVVYYFIYKIKSLILIYETEINNYIEKIEKMATTDALTGLYNRLELDNINRNELEKAKRYQHTFSVIMVDIDYFKSVNDTYGHQVGDTTLKAIASILQSSVRSVDSLGRWGGEEFLIICCDTDLDGALQLAEHIRVAIELYEFETIGHKSCSFGVSEYKEDDTQESMLKRADDALYRAKEEGRNRVRA